MLLLGTNSNPPESVGHVSESLSEGPHMRMGAGTDRSRPQLPLRQALGVTLHSCVPLSLGCPHLKHQGWARPSQQ